VDKVAVVDNVAVVVIVVEDDSVVVDRMVVEYVWVLVRVVT
jgi:hypothetical protein